jgi:hypothetical protein
LQLELLFLNPLLSSPSMAEVAFIDNPLSVAALGWVLIPMALRAFGWWLLTGPKGSPRVEIGETALIIGLYALAVAVFAWLTRVRKDRSPAQTPPPSA